MDLLTLIFIGRSGCGKGTQVEKMTEYVASKDSRDVFHLEAGGQFRAFIKKDTFSSNLAKKINETGGLQPEFLSIWAWGNEIVQNLKPNQHLFIDGTPRRLVEAKILDSAFTFFTRPKVQIIYLNVSTNWAIERMRGRGRSDDIEQKDIQARMDWFEKDVMPVLDYYKNHDSHIFHDINGEQEIEKVHEDIIKSLGI